MANSHEILSLDKTTFLFKDRIYPGQMLGELLAKHEADMIRESAGTTLTVGEKDKPPTRLKIGGSVLQDNYLSKPMEEANTKKVQPQLSQEKGA